MTARRNSNCSAGVPVHYYWWSCTSDDLTAHRVAAVEALVGEVFRQGRLRNPWTESMAKAEFRKRLEKAAAGTLVPVDEIKPVGDGLCSLFEIRWSGIQVTDVEPDGRQSFSTIQMRLLHAEPSDIGIDAVGLHAHEKVIVEGDPQMTRQLQDDQIATAENRFRSECSDGWRKWILRLASSTLNE